MSTYRKLFGIGPVARFVPCMVNSSPHSCCTATLCNVVCIYTYIIIYINNYICIYIYVILYIQFRGFADVLGSDGLPMEFLCMFGNHNMTHVIIYCTIYN